MKSRLLSSLVLCASLAGSPSAFAWTLHNGSFTSPRSGYPVGTPATLVTCSAGSSFGVSAADYWTVYINSYPAQVTTWMGTTPDGYSSLLVFAGDTANGAVQQFEPTNTKTGQVRLGAWVYVIKGKVAATIGNGGWGGATDVSTVEGGWEYLTTCGRTDGLNNEVTFYAAAGPAVFWLDDVTVTEDLSCPAS